MDNDPEDTGLLGHQFILWKVFWIGELEPVHEADGFEGGGDYRTFRIPVKDKIEENYWARRSEVNKGVQRTA